jgi:apolipoprotein N-acyltransferase
MAQRPFWTTPEFLAGLCSGTLYAVAVPPSPLGFLGNVALVPLLLVLFHPRRLREAQPLRLRVLILSFGLTRHLLMLHWLVLLSDAASMKFRWILLPAALVLLALYLTLWDGLGLWVCARLRRRYQAQAIWWFPVVWVVVEWARGAGELGFPWLRLAMTQLDYVPMIQLAGALGELGVSWMVAVVNVLVAVSWLALRREFPALGGAVLFRAWAPVALVLVLGGTWLYGTVTATDLEDTSGRGEGLRVGIIQGDVDLADKFDPARRDSTFIPYIQLSEEAARDGARLVVWPETAIPMDITAAPRYLVRVRGLVSRSEIFLLSGFPERQVGEEGRLLRHNSSLLMDDAGVIRARYRKMHLLPFGERMPFQGFFPLLGRLDFGQAEWDPGRERTIFEVDGQRFANLICFESIFSGPSRDAVGRGAEFLVNMSNDGWFGNTLGPYQHGLMAAMRSAENRVPTVRCANNGICFFVLPSGRVVDQTRLFERTAVVRTIYPNSGGSPYTRWGDLPLGVLLALSAALLAFVGRRPR